MSTERDRIIEAVRTSAPFAAEVHYAERGGYTIQREPRLYKVLENNLVRVVFPAADAPLEEGSVIAITCLYDREKSYNIYGHTIIAGPGVNGLLKAVYAPLGGAHPQAGNAGPKAISQFVAWKQVSWGKFLNEELELGVEEASRRWTRSFWKALDRLFGGGHLLNVPQDWYWHDPSAA